MTAQASNPTRSPPPGRDSSAAGAPSADEVGVTRQTISAVESGDYNPTIALCVRICRALGVTLDDLFWE